MNNDLISREALKKALHNFFDGKVIDEPAYILRDVFSYIDSAPTIFDPTVITCNTNHLSNEETEKLIKSIQNARIVPDNLQGWRYEERPQGKWKALTYHSCYCTNCHFDFDIMKCDFMTKMKFCPNCGAVMINGGEDNESN